MIELIETNVTSGAKWISYNYRAMSHYLTAINKPISITSQPWQTAAVVSWLQKHYTSAAELRPTGIQPHKIS